MLRWIRYATWAAIAVVAVLTLAVTGGWMVTDGPLALRGPQTTEPLALGGAFSLTDHRGRAVTERDFVGRPMAIFFGFTYCPSVCPTTLADISSFIEKLGPDADRMHWLFVGVDHERDTPESMALYLESFDRRILGLAGTEQQIAQIAKAFKIYYAKVPLEGGSYTMDHTAIVMLLDARRNFAGSIDFKERDDVAVQKLRTVLARQ